MHTEKDRPVLESGEEKKTRAATTSSKTMIKIKDVYLRFVYLISKDGGTPVVQKKLRGSSKPIPIYDLGNYYVHSVFNKVLSNYEWKFQSSTGQIDDVLQLHPFAGLSTDAFPVGNPGTWTHRINSPTNEVLFVVPHYNSFQKDHENVFGIVEEQIGELRLTVDFSSIVTKLGQEDSLFIDPPKAFLVRGQEYLTDSEFVREVPIDYISRSRRVFSAKINDVNKDSSLKLEWKINWNSLEQKSLSEDIPEGYVQNYYKASRLLEISPEASAALSRRCLQELLEDKGNIKKGNLFDEIQELINSKQLPSYLANAIDAIRKIGRFAAHPLKSTSTGQILEVEPGEAEWALDVLEKLFDFYYVMPSELERQKKALDAKLEDTKKKTKADNS
jgi:hypothetical protein